MNAKVMVEPVYSDHVQAIRCALNVSAKALGHATASWQHQVATGYRVSSIGPDLSNSERFVQDCMTRHLLHSNLSEREWSVLVVRFAPRLSFDGNVVCDKSELDEMKLALRIFIGAMPTDVSQEFTGWCAMRWAGRFPAGRGVWAEWEGETKESLRTLHRRCAEIYKAANEIENAAKEFAKCLLQASGLIA